MSCRIVSNQTNGTVPSPKELENNTRLSAQTNSYNTGPNYLHLRLPYESFASAPGAISIEKMYSRPTVDRNVSALKSLVLHIHLFA